MIKRVVTMMVALAVICGAHGAPRGLSWLSGAEAATIQLPQTGQTSCYDAAGATIACAGTGQDGELKVGTALPSPRFTDNGNGTVTDNLTILIWSKDANPSVTPKSWQQALDYIKTLNNSKYMGFNDWRLPNKNELHSLIDRSKYLPALTGGHPFINVQATSDPNNLYWSSTSGVDQTFTAWVANFGIGITDHIYKVGYYSNVHVWPVRSNQGSTILQKTGQTICYNESGGIITCSGTGQDGELQIGITAPTPRFSSNANQTVTDNLTGLMWSQNANLTSGTRTWQDALTFVTGLNKSSFLGFNDWRLPNANELAGLADPTNAGPALTAGHPFTNVQATLGVPISYWTSSSSMINKVEAWGVYMSTGSVYNFPKISGNYSSNYLWPVRGGQTSAIATNAACGPANLTTVTIAPTTDFCSTGTASAITGSGPWYWTCDGINGGTPAICTAYLSSTPVDPTTTTSKVYMGTNDRFTASNSGITIYGGAGYDTVTISDGISGVILDQNVERINFSDAAGNYTFKQTGNRINIYNAAGTLLLASAPVQGDADGTLLGFSNGSASALVNGGVMTLGGKIVSTGTPGALSPTLTP